ncbi:MAG: glycosyltransferase family 1 protein [Anaerolineales bacterium]|nr:glycosyltransferase family 1 protein [Anaerolineales bacterium]
MHITLLTIGSRGDVQPFVALAAGLQAAGFRTRLATHARFEALAAEYGLEFAPIHTDPQAMLHSDAGRAWLDSDRNPIGLIWNMIRLGKPIFEQLIQDAEAACVGTDLIIYSLFGNAAYSIGQKMGIPTILANLQPMFGPTAAFPAPGSPTWPSAIPLLGSWYNKFSYRLVEQVFWQPFRPLVNQWRKEHLGLPKIPFWGPYKQLYEDRAPSLYAYSPAVIPRPAEWPEWYHVTGYWFLDEPTDWAPPADLQAFLEAGPPPVYIGFGSMTDKNPAELTNMIVTALTKAGQRGILHSGWAGLNTAALPDTIFVVDEIPHAWLFPHMAAVVHHGGAGTTAAGLRAGVPNLVVPYFADQHFWGEQVTDLGVGPAALPRRSLTAAQLGLAIQTAVSNQPMRDKAAALGAQIRQEDGVARAIELIKQWWPSQAAVPDQR